LTTSTTQYKQALFHREGLGATTVHTLKVTVTSAAPKLVCVDQIMVHGTAVNPSSALLNVPLISQLPTFPTGCEAASTAMLITYGGHPVSVATIVSVMPYSSSDPNKGYVGNPRNWTGWTIYPPAMKGVVKRYLGTGVDLTGGSLNTIYSYLRAGKPVVVWLGKGALPGVNLHCVCVTGFGNGKIYYNDPYLNIKNKAVATSTFSSWWAGCKNRAMSY